MKKVISGWRKPRASLSFKSGQGYLSSITRTAGLSLPTDGRNVYDEGIYVGYRWFESKGIKPLFAFGHGLSYTAFEYGEAKLGSRAFKNGGIDVSIPVRNTGMLAGAEVVQLYISDPECSVDRPVKELKAFSKVYLAPGEEKTVKFSVTEEMLKFFDETSHSWKAESGEYVVHIGSASDDIRSSVSLLNRRE